MAGGGGRWCRNKLLAPGYCTQAPGASLCVAVPGARLQFCGMDGQTLGLRGSSCFGNGKVDFLEIANETVSPRSQIPWLKGGRKYGSQETGGLGRDEKERGQGQAREGTAVHQTGRRAPTHTGNTRTRTQAPEHTCIPSSYSKFPLTHCPTVSESAEPREAELKSGASHSPFLSLIPHLEKEQIPHPSRLSGRTSDLPVPPLTPLAFRSGLCHRSPYPAIPSRFFLSTLLDPLAFLIESASTNLLHVSA